MTLSVTLDVDAIQAFMATGLGVERNGMELTLGTALASIGEDGWDVAHQLSILPEPDAVALLSRLLERVEEGVPNGVQIARVVVEALPVPEVHGADLGLCLHLLLRSKDALFALEMTAIPALVASVSLVAMIERSSMTRLISVAIVAIAFGVALRCRSLTYALLLVGTSLLMSLPFLLIGIVAEGS